MSRDLPSFPLRMPPELRRAIENAAGESRRSLNAEIVARLEASLAEQKTIYDPACGSGGFLIHAMDYVREQLERKNDQPQVVSREEARARLEQLQLNEQQRQAVAAVLVAAIEALGIAPQKKTSNGD